MRQTPLPGRGAGALGDFADEDDAALSRTLEEAPVSDGLAGRVIREGARLPVLSFLEMDQRRAFDRDRARVFGEAFDNTLSAEEANAEFGVEGYLRFDAEVNRHEATWRNARARRRRFEEEVVARSDLNGLEVFAQGVAGTLTDPAALPTFLIGGEAVALGRLLTRAAPSALLGAGRGASVARGLLAGSVDGLVGGAVYEAGSYGLAQAAGEDYGLDDAAIGLVAGQLFGAAVGGVVGALTAPSGRAALSAGAGEAAEGARGEGPAPSPPSVEARPRPAPDHPIARTIRERAAARGEDGETAVVIALLESNLNPRADNEDSSAAGVYQFIDETWAAMGGGDRFDAALNIERGLELMAQNRRALSEGLNRSPEPWELYLAHQQGAGGALALLSQPDRPAVEVLMQAAGISRAQAARRITLNGGRSDMTAGAFAGLWRQRFLARGGPEAGGGAAGSAPGQAAPPVLAGLSESERIGGAIAAIEALGEDGPLDLGPLLTRGEGARLTDLDEPDATPLIPYRAVRDGVAVLRSGEEMPVRYALVELDDLNVSHDALLTENPTFPQALQPRDRGGRAASIEESFRLEARMNPRLLMFDVAVQGGAPVVAPDGTVESGNGRMIALARSAREGRTPAWADYQARLQAEGIDTTGFERPVLVRLRDRALTGAERVEFARQANDSSTEALSQTEQAVVDSRRLGPEVLDALTVDDPFSAGGRPFIKAFLARLTEGGRSTLLDAEGELSVAGKVRVEAALVQAAYGSERLTETLFEAVDSEIRSLGRALTQAAPAWAAMRQAAREGRMPPDLDLTASLISAVELVRHARKSRRPVAELLGERLDQTEMFSGAVLAPESEFWVRWMFRDAALTRPVAADTLAAGLTAWARRAKETPAGPDLFGDTPDARAWITEISETYGLTRPEPGLAFRGGAGGGRDPGWTTRAAEVDGGAVSPEGPAGRSEDGRGPDAAGGSADDDPPELSVDDAVSRLIGEGLSSADVQAVGAYGPVITGLEGRWAEAVRALQALRTGEVVGALDHPDVGPIDVLWAVSAGAGTDTKGLRRLLADRPQLVVDLPGQLAEMRVARRSDNRIVLQSETATAVVRLTLDGQEKRWLLTAFATEKGRRGGDTTGSASDLPGPAAQSPGRPTADTIIQSTPELKALQADTEALAAQAGLDLPEPEPSRDPAVLAEAVRAAAFCLTEGQ